MRKVPQHIKEALRKSQYGFTDMEIAHVARLLGRSRFPEEVDEATLEFQLLSARMALAPTPRNLAIFNNAIGIRAKAAGLPTMIAPVCPCGSVNIHYDVDGPDPMQRFCDDCGAPVSEEHIQTVIGNRIREVMDNLHKDKERPALSAVPPPDRHEP